MNRLALFEIGIIHGYYRVSGHSNISMLPWYICSRIQCGIDPINVIFIMALDSHLLDVRDCDIYLTIINYAHRDVYFLTLKHDIRVLDVVILERIGTFFRILSRGL